MSGFNFGSLSMALSNTERSGVSFDSKALKWENEEGAKDLIDAINNCAKLQYLNLAGNTLGVDAAKGVGEALAKHPEFEEALIKDLFTGRMKTEIPIALKHLGRGTIDAGAHLTVLDCSDNALGPNGMAGLVDWIKSSTCYSLQRLLLNNCGLGITGGKMLANALTECHTKSVQAGTPLQLKVFIAGRNRLENDGAKALAAVFEAIGTLEEIAMPQNGIYHPGIAALSEAFKKNTNMRVLNLNDNTITSKGAEHLYPALECMQKLENINFGDCLLKTAGAIHIAEAIADGHLALEVLNLGFNEIGPSGGYAVASAMHNKNQLQSLYLNGNQFGTESREQITELLAECQRADCLDELDEDDSDGENEEDEYDSEGDDGEEDENDDEYEDDDDEDTDDATEIAVGNANLTNQTLNTTTNGYSFSELNLTASSLNDSSICHTGDIDRPNTIETFCNTPCPSEGMFTALPDADKVTAFQAYLKTIDEKEYLTHTAFAILKLSAIGASNEEATKVALALYKECYAHATRTNQVMRVNNFFLTQLGLLKAEDRSFQPVYNLKACRGVIQTAISQQALPTEATSMFNLFLEQFK